MKYKVGILGNGFVGESQTFAFEPKTSDRDAVPRFAP